MTTTTRPFRPLRRRPRALPEAMPIKPASTAQPWDVKLAAYEARLDSFNLELQRQGRRQEEGFERLDRTLATMFAKLDSATTKPTPWAIIISAIVGVAGLGLTTTTGLALWANAYFGSSIKFAEAQGTSAHTRIDKAAERVDAKLERLTEFAWATRAALHSSPSWQPPAPPALAAPTRSVDSGSQ